MHILVVFYQQLLFHAINFGLEHEPKTQKPKRIKFQVIGIGNSFRASRQGLAQFLWYGPDNKHCEPQAVSVAFFFFLCNPLKMQKSFLAFGQYKKRMWLHLAFWL